MIERKIIIGLITSTEFCKTIIPILNLSNLESGTAKMMASWCVAYFSEYNRAPMRDIGNVYFSKLREGSIPKELAEEIEVNILPSLSQEYEEEAPNIEFLIKDTKKYLTERHLEAHISTLTDLLDSDAIDDAEALIRAYMPLKSEEDEFLDLSKKENLKRVRAALNQINHPVFHYPGVIGDMLNPQLVRGGFVAFMASEKRGKSFWLLDMAVRAAKQKQKVAFFQAGDMTEAQQLKRISTYLTNKPNKEKKGKSYLPLKDCIYNQMNTCTRPERENNFGVLTDEKWTEITVRKDLTKDDIIDILPLEPDYTTCHNCKEYIYNKWGSVWLKEIKNPQLMTSVEAIKAIRKFFVDYNREFRLSTHSNGTLSVAKIDSTLQAWEKDDGYVPDLIIIDYADILISEKKTEFRHQQNEIWKALRGLSQKKSWLVVTVTQADAKSYEQNRLTLSNFSEDKRKYAHVTAMFGLNQDPKGREKKLGVLWINELMIREGTGDITNEVAVLQHLDVGKPFLTSFL